MDSMKQSGKQHGLWFHILDVVFNIVVIVAIVAGIRTFLVSPFQVEGNSMTSTLEDNEYIIINKLTYRIGRPGRGDIVVFRPPNEQKKYYVKRVIGMPGDEVILRGGDVFVQTGSEDDAKKLPEEYLDERNRGKTFRHPPGSGDRSEVRYAVPDGSYFLLGDNRQGSYDSRSFTLPDGSTAPIVPEASIKGRVWFVALPVTKIHAFGAPEYDL
ncbi:signal peptidase I [Candidatus Peregrinibacteria bacterium]|nr:signal peptidase I [Candidatus Peregrinibacteria bacterium]